jgi:hypothetical protein
MLGDVHSEPSAERRRRKGQAPSPGQRCTMGSTGASSRPPPTRHCADVSAEGMAQGQAPLLPVLPVLVPGHHCALNTRVRRGARAQLRQPDPGLQQLRHLVARHVHSTQHLGGRPGLAAGGDLARTCVVRLKIVLG